MSTTNSPTINELYQTLEKDGVIVIKNLYSKELIANLTNEYQERWNLLQSKLPDIEKEERISLLGFGKKQKVIDVFHYDGSTILGLAPGRYDFDNLITGSFVEEEFFAPQIVKELMEKYLVADYDHKVGALPSVGKSDAGPWHRDIYSLFDNEQIDVSLPDFYFTLLIPLVPVNQENGATEFILGSHKQAFSDVEKNNLPHSQPDAQPGDLVLFNGKILHRGRENLSDAERPVLYIVYKKKWYNDYY